MTATTPSMGAGLEGPGSSEQPGSAAQQQQQKVSTTAPTSTTSANRKKSGDKTTGDKKTTGEKRSGATIKKRSGEEIYFVERVMNECLKAKEMNATEVFKLNEWCVSVSALNAVFCTIISSDFNVAR